MDLSSQSDEHTFLKQLWLTGPGRLGLSVECPLLSVHVTLNTGPALLEQIQGYLVNDVFNV